MHVDRVRASHRSEGPRSDVAVANVPELDDAVPTARVEVERVERKVPRCKDCVFVALVFFVRPALVQFALTFIPDFDLCHSASNDDLPAVS